MTKQEHYTQLVEGMLQRELTDLKKIVKDIEDTLNAELLDIDSKAIKTLEYMQSIKFDTSIFRELQFMKKD